MAIANVLAAVSGESCDADVVRLACHLLRPDRGRLHVLYVIEVDRRWPVDAEIGSATAAGESVLQDMEAVARAEKFKTEGELVQSRHAGTAVVSEAYDKMADAIVLGATYRRRFGSFSLGDAVPYVLENAPCRVVLYRDRAGPWSRDGRDGNGGR